MATEEKFRIGLFADDGFTRIHVVTNKEHGGPIHAAKVAQSAKCLSDLCDIRGDFYAEGEGKPARMDAERLAAAVAEVKTIQEQLEANGQAWDAAVRNREAPNELESERRALQNRFADAKARIEPIRSEAARSMAAAVARLRAILCGEHAKAAQKAADAVEAAKAALTAALQVPFEQYMLAICWHCGCEIASHELAAIAAGGLVVA